MSPEILAVEIEGLKSAYGEVSIAAGAGASGQTLVRIGTVALPAGCAPAGTPALVVVQTGQRPQLYVKAGILLPNGVVPRSTSVVQVAGMEWMQFSYSFPWDENAHTLMQFVEASLRRFALAE